MTHHEVPEKRQRSQADERSSTESSRWEPIKWISEKTTTRTEDGSSNRKRPSCSDDDESSSPKKSRTEDEEEEEGSPLRRPQREFSEAGRTPPIRSLFTPRFVNRAMQPFSSESSDGNDEEKSPLHGSRREFSEAGTAPTRSLFHPRFVHPVMQPLPSDSTAPTSYTADTTARTENCAVSPQYETAYTRGELRTRRSPLPRATAYPPQKPSIPPRSEPVQPKPTRSAIALLAASYKISAGLSTALEKRFAFVGGAPCRAVQQRLIDEVAQLDRLHDFQEELRKAAEEVIKTGNLQAARKINRDDLTAEMKQAVNLLRRAEKAEKEARAELKLALA